MDHDPLDRTPPWREVTDADADGLVALIGGVFAEYPGCVLDLEDLDRDLLAPRSTFAAHAARLWVVEDAGEVVACAGVAEASPGPHAPSLPGRVADLKRLYVRADQRGRGLGTALLDLVHGAAADRGAEAIELWSDTRFLDAHRRYEAMGYERRPVVRELHDPSNTSEYTMWRRLVPTTPTSSATWAGAASRERCHLVDGRVGHRLQGTVVAEHRLDYDVLVDRAWCTRTVRVDVDGAPRLRLTADGLGHWWEDGQPRPDLAGCLDVDLEPTSATTTLAVRRAPDGFSGPVARWDAATGRVTATMQESAPLDDAGD